jgi:chromosome segregation ATPase
MFDAISERATVSGENVMDYLHALADGLDGLNIRIDEQQRNAVALIERMNAAGGATARDIDLAQQAIKYDKLLGKEQLSQLQSALGRVNQQMQTLNQTAASTLSNLKDQLDQLQGDEAAIEKRDYQAKKAEYTAELAQAKQLGDRKATAEYQQSLDLLNQIHAIKLKNIQADQQAAAQEKQQQALPANVTPLPSAAPAQRTVRIELAGPKGEAAGQFTQDDADQLLDMLDQAGLRAGAA